MSIKVEESVLHIEYKKMDDIPVYVKKISDQYEGEIKDRIGFNFPMEFVEKNDKKVYGDMIKKYGDIKYVIVYKKGDVLTKKHELCHAKYALDKDYKNKVLLLWDSLGKKYKDGVLKMLKNMNYPDNMDILIDEFQAYFYTEKSGFFGKM